MEAKPKKSIVRLPCACANLRRAGRVVTRYYDAMLRPSGLEVSQFTLLQALNETGEISQKQLAALLEIDSTTLTRTLAPLRGKGWLHSKAGADRRELRLFLTVAGKRKYEAAMPYWEKAQKGLERSLGKAALNRLIEAAVRAAGISLDE